MVTHPPSWPVWCFVFALIAFSSGCKKQQNQTEPDHPRLTPNVSMQDVRFHSAALDREMPYRVVLPARISSDEKLPVVYLLHGGGGGFRDWTNYSDIARFAERGLILVMPEGESSYYVNSAEQPKDKFEDYIVQDLIREVEARFPAQGDPRKRAVGVSMGGFGAVTIALKHPQMFAFAGGLSSALDVPSRQFSLKRVSQSLHYKTLFGPMGSETRRANDPYILVRSADLAEAPYFFLTCGEQEGLLSPNKKFATLLNQRHFRYEFHTKAGGHDWNQWNSWLGALFDSMVPRLSAASSR